VGKFMIENPVIGKSGLRNSVDTPRIALDVSKTCADIDWEPKHG